jgi:hypothetical protein
MTVASRRAGPGIGELLECDRRNLRVPALIRSLGPFLFFSNSIDKLD